MGLDALTPSLRSSTGAYSGASSLNRRRLADPAFELTASVSFAVLEG